MNSIILLSYLVVLIGGTIYLLKWGIRLLSARCCVYVYDSEGEKSFWGYMRKTRATKKHRVYVSVGEDKCLGEVQIKDDGHAWVYAWKHGYSPDEKPCELGYVDLRGRIFTSDNILVGHVGQDASTPDTDGICHWYELFLRRHALFFNEGDSIPKGTCMETGRLRSRKANEHTLLARVSAFYILYKRQNWDRPWAEERTTEIYAWGDTALLSSVVFMFLYGIFYLCLPSFILFPVIGERLSFLLATFLQYLLVWAIVRDIKIEMSLDERPIGWWLALFNSNVGLGVFNWMISLFSGIGLLLSVFVFGGDFAPLLAALLIGNTVNNRTYPRQVWDVQCSFRYLPDETISPIPDEGDVIREYSWRLDSPDTPNVQTSLRLYFKEVGIEELRKLNPFRNGGDFDVNVNNMLSQRLDNRHLDIINRHIAVVSIERQLSMLETMQFILDFVQCPNIEYGYDKDTTGYLEYVRYPDETLFDKVGDCDCKAMLAAALFHQAGYRVLYITSDTHAAVAVECNPDWFENWGNPYVNKAVITYQGSRYFFCETTGDNFRIGDAPDDINKFTSIKFIDKP